MFGFPTTYRSQTPNLAETLLRGANVYGYGKAVTRQPPRSEAIGVVICRLAQLLVTRGESWYILRRPDLGKNVVRPLAKGETPLSGLRLEPH